MRKPIAVRIHDASIGIWQDDARDETFRTDIYAELIRQMRKRGWSVKADPNVRKNYRSISQDHRLGARGAIRCKIEISGRVVTVEFWSVVAPRDNRNGRRYDFGKLARMPYIDQLRVELEFRRITRWVETLAPVKVTRSDDHRLTPMQSIQKRYTESWHTDKELGRPHWGQDYNRTAKGGVLLEHGQTVWIADHKGRIVRGTAYYNLNSMWWVVAGGELRNESCGYLYTQMPDDLRTKRNEKLRRTRLERELEIAVVRMNFQRADILKHILFGFEQTYMIWARDKQLYYRAQYSGYAADRISAGKYTKAEAEAECRRVPHELEMICPDGTSVRFDKRAA